MKVCAAEQRDHERPFKARGLSTRGDHSLEVPKEDINAVVNDDNNDELQTYFECDTAEALQWVFDFNPPQDGEESAVLNGGLSSKQVWFDLNSLFGLS